MKNAAATEHGQYSDTILCTHLSCAVLSIGTAPRDEDSAMCSEQTTAFTLRGLLRDPMIRSVMASDGVTDHEMIALVRRVATATALRPQLLSPARPLPAVEHSAAW